MDKLPVFPLNTVVFPGTPLKLHIFEERYRTMVHHCLSEMQPFVVSLISSGEEANAAPAEPNRIACTVKITQMEPLPDKRLNITVTGCNRVELMLLHFDQPFLTATVRDLPLPSSAADNLASVDRKLRALLLRYAKLLSQVMELRIEPDDIPANTDAMAFLAAYILQIPMLEKQQLLAASNLPSLVLQLLSTYQREVVLFDCLRQPTYHASADKYAFSAN